MSKTERARLAELIDTLAVRQERMRVSLEAIKQEAARGSFFTRWHERIGDLAALGLRNADG